MKELKIDERFKGLLPELTAEEFCGLRESIMSEGCREPITVWRGIIVDGHNRYKICRELDKPFQIREIDFADPDSVMDWIDANQLARRNLTPDAFRLALGRRYNRQKNNRGGDHKSKGQVDTLINTAANLATEHGVSAATVKRAGRFALEVESDPELQNAIKTRKPISKAKKEKNRNVRRERIINESKKASSGRALIYVGDCLSVFKNVKPIDLLITDPPYFTDGDFTKHVSYFLSKVKTTGQAYVFAGADPEEVSAYLNMERHGMILEQILVWNYNNTGQRQPSQRYNSNYQIAFYFRGANASPINKPSDGTHQYACQTVNAPDGRIGDRLHKWQKPMDLIERYVLNSSREGDIVLDPFAGTGTVLLAAAKHGRYSVGCEIDASTAKIAVERGCVLI